MTAEALNNTHLMIERTSQKIIKKKRRLEQHYKPTRHSRGTSLNKGKYRTDSPHSRTLKRLGPLSKKLKLRGIYYAYGVNQSIFLPLLYLK
jgi:hypothetical protein